METPKHITDAIAGKSRYLTDWEPLDLSFRVEFEELFPRFSRAFKSTTPYSAWYTGVGSPGDGSYSPGGSRSCFFLQGANGAVDCWIAIPFDGELPAQASTSLRTFTETIGLIGFGGIYRLGYGVGKYQLDHLVEVTSDLIFYEDLPKTTPRFPFEESLFVGEMDDAGVYLERGQQIFSVSVAEDDLPLSSLEVSDAVRADEFGLVYQSSQLVTFADLVERVIIDVLSDLGL